MTRAACCDSSQRLACDARADKAVPWGLFLRSRPVWAIIVAHFCYNWGTAVSFVVLRYENTQAVHRTKG